MSGLTFLGLLEPVEGEDKDAGVVLGCSDRLATELANLIDRPLAWWS